MRYELKRRDRLAAAMKKRMKDKQNVALITIDCLRADHLSCCGYSKETTPNIDDFARKGVLFTQAIANGSSTPTSFPSILTSTYPLMYPDYPHVSRFRTIISEVLKKVGYKTAGFHSNPYTSRYYYYDRGFEVFEDFLPLHTDENRANKAIRSITRKNEKLLAFARKLYRPLKNAKKRTRPMALPYKRASEINQKAISWLKKNLSGFFVWLHYMDTHHPFVPPAEFCTSNAQMMKRAQYIIRKNPSIVSRNDLQNIIDLYDGTIMYVDSILGELFQEFQRLGIFDNTLFIITADHGEEFREHGGFSHTAKLYDELIHVPLLLMAPGIPANATVSEQVSLLDLAPTILDYLGLPKCEGFQGNSLLPVTADVRNVAVGKGVVSETRRKKGKVSLSVNEGYRLVSYRTEKWKYIFNEEGNLGELYDLENDQREAKNLYDKEKAIARKLEKKVAVHIQMEKRMQKQVTEIARIKNRVKHLKMRKLARVHR